MSRSNKVTQRVGVAAALGAALTAGCSSDSPEPQPQADAAAGDAQHDALSELFETGSPEDVALQLEAEASDDDGAGGVPIYKGVSLP
jgi:uncharacterized lipoprotein